ncbi:hypothetical protein GCM10011583_00300 [Streptomyces camponoticapitis]|uniref:Uncharacterized protein n=1 Tax=Streptomyces camponoticapitis TaxID=1616125 RepID=A0ABQ2DTJ6_9ACTN|nr:hypothetical protein GCM10011583_00300 [Streptomyces camponoticapitis]
MRARCADAPYGAADLDADARGSGGASAHGYVPGRAAGPRGRHVTAHGVVPPHRTGERPGRGVGRRGGHGRGSVGVTDICAGTAAPTCTHAA